MSDRRPLRRARPAGPRRGTGSRHASPSALVARSSLRWAGGSIDTGQFSAVKWEQFQYARSSGPARRLLATLKAAAIAAVLALASARCWPTGRLSRPPVVRALASAFVELFRAVPLLILIFFFYYGRSQFGFGLDAVVGASSSA